MTSIFFEIIDNVSTGRKVTPIMKELRNNYLKHFLFEKNDKNALDKGLSWGHASARDEASRICK